MYKNTFLVNEPISKNILDETFLYLYHEMYSNKKLLKKGICLKFFQNKFYVDVFVTVNFLYSESSNIFTFLVISENDGEFHPDKNNLKLFTIFFSVDPIVFYKQCHNITKKIIYSQAKTNFDIRCHPYDDLTRILNELFSKVVFQKIKKEIYPECIFKL